MQYTTRSFWILLTLLIAGITTSVGGAGAQSGSAADAPSDAQSGAGAGSQRDRKSVV